ncbi:MAG: BolA/IbaG family iron-sulfur metabolism protein [Gammaproteobacteria bacterium]|nr:BolA/IbaG family iron-sulfur metabolism protein [Gammaproteobacteria bacterium]
MNTQATIHSKLVSALNPILLQVDNESHLHSGPATESHFKVTAVAEVFDGMPAVKRHQRVYGSLAAELANGVHALALHLYSPAEWAQRQQTAPVSPQCRGGSKQA